MEMSLFSDEQILKAYFTEIERETAERVEREITQKIRYEVHQKWAYKLLYKYNFSIEKIAELTELSVEEVKAIEDKMKADLRAE